ncbi:c-type cytochrome [Nitrosophilus alvini]|uniref:c-type cytochrome n=1 Tax=Nitrosophilus alvini TaxID=2714855 RepID=UPI00190B4F88|nr:c-type cytochrome [Nitrosophilus alvini]
MKRFVFVVGFLFLFTGAVNAEDGRTLFEKKCSVCHITGMPALEQKRKMVAPPAAGIMFHVKENYKTKQEAVDFIVDYVLNPSKDKAVCMSKTIKRFGVMPSMKGNVSKDELIVIAKYMYDNFPPNEFTHSANGMGSCDNNCNSASSKSGKNYLPGEKLAQENGCFACHNVMGAKKGPGFIGISLRYKREYGEGAVGKLADVIKNGSKGRWPRFKKIVMPAYLTMHEEDRIAIAEWIVSLKPPMLQKGE